MFAASAHVPLTLYASSSHEINRGYRLVVYILVLMMGERLVVEVMVRLGASPRLAYPAIAAFTLIVSHAGALAPVVGGGTDVVVLIAAWLGLALVCLNRRENAVELFSMGVVFFLIAAPVAQLVLNVAARDDSQLDTYQATPVVDVGQGPDVWLIILDGYPSEFTLETDLEASPTLAEALASRGFAVNGNAVSPYAMTHLAVPAMLNGTYPVTGGSTITAADTVILGRIIGGESRLFTDLDGHGYEITVVESGWHLSNCQPIVDTCIAAPWPDETIGTLVSKLPGRLPWVTDAALSIGAENSLDWLRQPDRDIINNGSPDLVMVHVLAPHPPMFLDEDCRRLPRDASREGVVLGALGMTNGEIQSRLKAYGDQLRCVNESILEFVDLIPAESVIAIVGDHGTDMRAQLAIPPTRWTSEMITERLLTLSALRGEGCDDAPIDHLIDLAARVTACVSPAPASEAELRVFAIWASGLGLGDAPPLVELSEASLANLRSVSEGSQPDWPGDQ